MFDLEFFSRFTAILSYLSGAKKIVGFYRYGFEGLYRGNFLTHKVQYNPTIHISKLFLSLGSLVMQSEKNTPEIDGKIDDKDIILPHIIPKDIEVIKIRNLLEKSGIYENDNIFLFSIGEGMLPLREWPIDNFVKLAQKILENDRNCIIIVGAKDAETKAEKFLQVINSSRCISFAGRTTMSELLAIFSIAKVLISNDCGLAHVAALSSIKKITIFGPETPEVFKPLGENNFIVYAKIPCSPCFSILNNRMSFCRDNKCLKDVKWEDINNLL